MVNTQQRHCFLGDLSHKDCIDRDVKALMEKSSSVDNLASAKSQTVHFLPFYTHPPQILLQV